MTIREDPGGESPSAATPAQAVGAGQVQELRAARQQALADAQELSTRLAREQAQAKKLSRSYKQAVRRNVAKVKELARQTSWVTPTQYDELDGEIARERSLARELDRVQAQVQARTQALERAEAQAQELERALALAMAQARTLARARTPRYRIAAFLRLLWQLRSPQRMWGGVVRNLVLGMGVVRLAVWILPTADRDRWKNESYSELEDLKHEGAPLLGRRPPDRVTSTRAGVGAMDRCVETVTSSTVAAPAEAHVDRSGNGGCDLPRRYRRDRSAPDRVPDASAHRRLAVDRRGGSHRVVQGAATS